MTEVTRRYNFSASHRLHASGLTDAENQALYGKCNNPYGHGHNYVLDVTYAGPVGAENGLIAPRADVDAVVLQNVLRPIASRNLNLDVPEFEYALVPTTENLAAVILDRLRAGWPCEWSAQPRRVHVQETDRNGITINA